MTTVPASPAAGDPSSAPLVVVIGLVLVAVVGLGAFALRRRQATPRG